MIKIIRHFLRSIDKDLIKSFFERPPADKVIKAKLSCTFTLYFIFSWSTKIFFICQMHGKERNEYIRNVFVYCIFWGQICNRYSFNIQRNEYITLTKHNGYQITNVLLLVCFLLLCSKIPLFFSKLLEAYKCLPLDSFL